MRFVHWESTLCKCCAKMEVDGDRHRLKVKPCSYDCVRWCIQVSYDNLINRIYQMTGITWDGLATLRSNPDQQFIDGLVYDIHGKEVFPEFY